MPDSDPASLLSPIRERYACTRAPITGNSATTLFASASDVPVLLAAVEAALKLAGKQEAETARLDALAELKADPASRAEVSVRAQAFQECARALGEAITTALTGQAK